MAIELKNINPVILDNDVGIGKTPSPGGPKLEVSTTIKLGGGTAANTERLMVNTASGTSAGIQLKQDGQGSWTITNPASATYLTISEGSSPIIRVTSSGDVGIGQTSPGGKLDVNGTIKATSILNAALASPTMTTGTILASTELGAIQSSGLVFSGSSVVSTKSFTFSLASASLAVTATTGNSSLTMTHNSATNTISFYSGATLKGQLTNTGEEMRHKFNIHSFYNLAGSGKVWITNTGAVGIGIDTPSRTLHVVGDALFSSNLKALGLAASGGIIDFDDAAAGANRLQLAGGNLSLSLGGATPKFVFTNQSRVGIGTSSPQHALDVVGSIRASNSIIIGNTGAIFPSTATSHTRVMACPIDGARGVYDNDVLWMWDGLLNAANTPIFMISNSGGSHTASAVSYTADSRISVVGTATKTNDFSVRDDGNFKISFASLSILSESTIPTNYIVLTLPCDKNIHNVLHLRVRGLDRISRVNAWICNGNSTSISKKLQAFSTMSSTSDSNYTAIGIGPKNTPSRTGHLLEWLSIIIPQSYLETYSFADGTATTGRMVKIALNLVTGSENNLSFNGISISRNPTGFTQINGRDVLLQTNGGPSSDSLVHTHDGYLSNCRLANNSTYTDLRIPIAGPVGVGAGAAHRDLIVGFQVLQDNSSHRALPTFWLGGSSTPPTYPNQIFYLSKFNAGTLGSTGPTTYHYGYWGFVVPKELVALHMHTAGSGLRTLNFVMQNNHLHYTFSFAGMYTEQINRIGNDKTLTANAMNMKNNNYASNSIVDLATYDGV